MESYKESEAGELNKWDWKRIGKSFLIGAAGILATYIAAQIELIDWATVGKYGFIIAPAASWVVNFLRVWAKGK